MYNIGKIDIPKKSNIIWQFFAAQENGVRDDGIATGRPNRYQESGR